MQGLLPAAAAAVASARVVLLLALQFTKMMVAAHDGSGSGSGREEGGDSSATGSSISRGDGHRPTSSHDAIMAGLGGCIGMLLASTCVCYVCARKQAQEGKGDAHQMLMNANGSLVDTTNSSAVPPSWVTLPSSRQIETEHGFESISRAAGRERRSIMSWRW